MIIMILWIPVACPIEIISTDFDARCFLILLWITHTANRPHKDSEVLIFFPLLFNTCERLKCETVQRDHFYISWLILHTFGVQRGLACGCANGISMDFGKVHGCIWWRSLDIIGDTVTHGHMMCHGLSLLWCVCAQVVEGGCPVLPCLAAFGLCAAVSVSQQSYKFLLVWCRACTFVRPCTNYCCITHEKLCALSQYVSCPSLGMAVCSWAKTWHCEGKVTGDRLSFRCSFSQATWKAAPTNNPRSWRTIVPNSFWVPWLAGNTY